MKFGILSVILFIVLPGCMQLPPKKSLIRYTQVKPASCVKEQNLDKTDTIPNITVWIHGTRLFPNPFFKTYFYTKEGLHHYKELPANCKQYKIAETLLESDPDFYSIEHFYIYGWSGVLSFSAREKAAQKLYQQLCFLRTNYKNKHGSEPHFTIITHSHGGNVALLLAKVKQPNDAELFIERLILLACPVQKQTMCYIASPLFKKIYSLYSILDVLQVADPQGLQMPCFKTPLFSERLFPTDSKIEQIAVKLDKRSLMHIEFVSKIFLGQLSHIINEINHWRALYNLSHCNWEQIHKCLCLNTKLKKNMKLCFNASEFPNAFSSS